MTRCIGLKLQSWQLQYSVENNNLTLRNFPRSLGKTRCVHISRLWWYYRSLVTGGAGRSHTGDCGHSGLLWGSRGRGDWTSAKLLSAVCQTLGAIIVFQDTAGESWDDKLDDWHHVNSNYSPSSMSRVWKLMVSPPGRPFQPLEPSSRRRSEQSVNPSSHSARSGDLEQFIKRQIQPTGKIKMQKIQ